MNSRRRVWQHQFEDRSEAQLSDVFGSVGWVVERLNRDYGEDLYARPFEKGNPTGHDFFIQLKSTDDINQYKKSDGWLSYSVDLTNIIQWFSYTIPVIFIIWDIVNKIGYWTHVQPTIKSKVEKDPAWLENKSGAKEPTRKIQIPMSQIIVTNNLDSLNIVISIEWRKIEQGKRHFEIFYQESFNPIDGTHGTHLPPSIRHQLRIVELNAFAIANPNDAKIWLDLASAYYEIQNMSEALKAINKSWSLDPDQKNIKQVRACVLAEFAIRNGKPASLLYEAISLFEKSRNSLNEPLANYNIGNCYLELGQVKESIAYFDKALNSKLEPKLAAQIWTNRGNAITDLGNSEDAAKSFENSIKLDPSLWNAHASWAALEVRESNFGQACVHFREAFHCNSELLFSGDRIVYWFALSLFKIGELKESLSNINHFLSANPTDKNGILLKVHLLSRLSQLDKSYSGEAIAFLKKGLLDNPANMEVRSELNILYLENSLNNERRELLKETISFKNAPPIAFYEYAEVLESEEKIHEAIACLEKALKLKPIDKKIHHSIAHSLARLKRETGQYSEAILYYKIALNGIKNPYPILEKISDCYHFLNDYESCLVVITQALLLGAHGISWWKNLNYSLSMLGIESNLYSNFLQQALTKDAKFSEEEIRKQIKSLGNKAI